MTAAELVRELHKPCKVYVGVQHTENDRMCVQAIKSEVIFILKRQENPDVEVRAYKDADGDWIIN
jgi:hypothetical protein